MADRVIRPQFRRAEPPQEFRVTWARDLAGIEPAPIEWIVEGLFPRKHVTMLTAPPGAGKSFSMLMLMLASWAAEPQWFGRAIAPRVRAYAVFSEDAELQVHARFNRIVAEYGVDLLDLQEEDIAWTAEPADGKAFDPVLYRCAPEQPGRPTDLWDQIAGPMGHCTELGCGLLILDNASTLLDGEDSRHIYGFCTLLKSYAAAQNVAIILLHHPNKAGTAIYSGRQAWEKSLRHIVSLERPKTYNPHTGEDVDKLLLHVPVTNLPGARPRINLQWREGMLEVAEAPPSLRTRFPLTQSERADLDLRVLAALRYELGRGHRVLSDPTKAESLFARLRKSASWQHVAKADIESAIERLIHRGQIVSDKDIMPTTLRPA